MNAPPRTVFVRGVVPFHDVDSMGVVWHGHYYKYFEIARTEYFRSIGFDVAEMQRSGYVWPVIESHCRYILPLRYGVPFQTTAELVDTEHRIKFTYSIVDLSTQKKTTVGHSVQATVRADTGELLLDTPALVLERISGTHS